jgi:hypothetical protein
LPLSRKAKFSIYARIQTDYKEYLPLFPSNQNSFQHFRPAVAGMADLGIRFAHFQHFLLKWLQQID